MQKDLFKNSNSYSISIIEAEQEIPYDHTVTILNCKSLSELENDYKNIAKSQESKKVESKVNDGADFETAIKATEYGKFNWLVLFAAFWSYMSSMYTTTSISLILPSAECDLNLRNFDKGMLNSVVYIGMIVSAFFWGLVSDAIGRRNLLMVAFALDVFFSILVSLAQNFTLLLIAKLLTGFISSAPIALMASFLAENHSSEYRATVIQCSGFFTSMAAITQPLLAWLIIPQPIRLVLFNGFLVLPSWRLFLLVSATPSILAFTIMSLLDESPKFLMFQGKNEEALRVFKRIYNMNTGKPGDTFPVVYLRNEQGNNQGGPNGENSVKETLRIGWRQMVPMFQKPHFPLILLPCVAQLFTLLGVNSIRLWSPQLFSSAIDREKHAYNLSDVSSICELLAPVTSSEVQEEIMQCSQYVVEDKVYFNSMITGVVTGIGYLISGYIVKKLEKKWVMLMAYSLSIACCVGLYWSTTSSYLLAVVSVHIAVTSTSATALLSAVIDIFPTSLRTTAVSLCLTFGRMGAMIGNLVFPILLDWHCTAPFILIGIVIFLAAFLTLFLPKTKGKRLE